MESLAAFLVTVAIIAGIKDAPRISSVFFGLTLCLLVWLLHTHATDALPLNF